MNKTLKPLPKVMMVSATFEKWEDNLETAPAEFLNELIAKVKAEHPRYSYVRSTFDYTADGNIDFKLRFILKERKGILKVIR